MRRWRACAGGSAEPHHPLQGANRTEIPAAHWPRGFFVPCRAGRVLPAVRPGGAVCSFGVHVAVGGHEAACIFAPAVFRFEQMVAGCRKVDVDADYAVGLVILLPAEVGFYGFAD